MEVQSVVGVIRGLVHKGGKSTWERSVKLHLVMKSSRLLLKHRMITDNINLMSISLLKNSKRLQLWVISQSRIVKYLRR